MSLERVRPSGSRIAVRLPQAWCVATPDAILEVAELADELGLDVSVQDHLLADDGVSPCGPHHAGDDRAVYEAHTTLAWVAARTTLARLVAGVYVLPYRHPVWLAKEIATLDALSKARLVVGVGVGALRARREDAGQRLAAHGSIAEREFDTFGVPGHRGRRMDEAIDAMVALWTQDPASFHGETVRFQNLDLYPRPDARARPPIWVGGRSAAALERAVLRGDAWYPSQASVPAIEAGATELERIAAATGRPVPSIVANLFVSLDRDRSRAHMELQSALGRRFTDAGALASATLSGTPGDVLEQARRYMAAGVRSFDLKILPLTRAATRDAMRLLATEVLPGLSEAG